MSIQDRNFTEVKPSPIHGRGVFAKRQIPKGTRIFEYTGLKLSHQQLVADLVNGLTSRIYVMKIDENWAVDAERGGNDARFINHCCDPNCEVLVFNNTPYIYAIFEISEGAELSFDYKLGLDDEDDLSLEQLKEFFPCHCGASNCRGTLVAQKS